MKIISSAPLDLDLCFLFACLDIDWFQDAWDAESEEENSEKSEEAAKPVKVKKKKTLAQKIAEKEEAAALARQERLAREEEEKQLNTPEGELMTGNDKQRSLIIFLKRFYTFFQHIL